MEHSAQTDALRRVALSHGARQSASNCLSHADPDWGVYAPVEREDAGLVDPHICGHAGSALVSACRSCRVELAGTPAATTPARPNAVEYTGAIAGRRSESIAANIGRSTNTDPAIKISTHGARASLPALRSCTVADKDVRAPDMRWCWPRVTTARSAARSEPRPIASVCSSPHRRAHSQKTDSRPARK